MRQIQCIYVDAMCIFEIASCFSTNGSSTHKLSPGARPSIGQFVRGFSKAPSAFQTSYDARPGTVRCLHGWSPFKSDDLNFKQNRPVPVRCVVTPTGRRPGTVWCPADVTLPPKTIKTPYRRPKYSTLTLPGTIRCLKLTFYRTIVQVTAAGRAR